MQRFQIHVFSQNNAEYRAYVHKTLLGPMETFLHTDLSKDNMGICKNLHIYYGAAHEIQAVSLTEKQQDKDENRPVLTTV